MENIFQETFDVLSAVFSLCSILDIVSLNAKDGKLVYKLCGYKNINGELNIDNSFSLLKNTENEYFLKYLDGFILEKVIKQIRSVLQEMY